MQFSSVADSGGIVEDVDYILSTNSTSYPLADKTRSINRHMEDCVSLIISADGRWEWDDSNQTDLPIGTTTLVNNQQDYNIAGATFLKITRVEVKDINGDYYRLDPISEKDVTTQAMTEFQKTAGRPLYYDKLGDSVFLYPKPSTSQVTASAGLKVYYQRLPSYFLSSDTTKTPGFAPLYHRILSLGAAIDYCLKHGLNSKMSVLLPMMEKMKQGLVEFYSSRSRDESVRMRTHKTDYGQMSDHSEYGYRGSDKTAFY